MSGRADYRAASPSPPPSPAGRGATEPVGDIPSRLSRCSPTSFSCSSPASRPAAIYALVAIGFTLLWQTSQTINFAQGEFVMLPAFFVLIGMGYFGLSFWPAVALGAVVSIVTLGFLFKRLMVDPMLHHGVLPLVIATIGLAILMKEAVREFYGADAQPFPPLAAATNVTVFGAAIDVQSLVVLAISIAAVVALQLFLNGTRTGRCMQATAQNPTVARLLGIPVERMILYTFLINAALVTLASLLITPIYLAKFTNGELARPLRLHRGDHRRLQPGARRHRRRPAAGRDRQFRRRLSSRRNTEWRCRC